MRKRAASTPAERARKRRQALQDAGAKPIYAMLHPKAAKALEALKRAHGSTDRAVNHALVTAKVDD